MTGKRMNPWAEAQEQRRRVRVQTGVLVALALALGAAIGLLLPAPGTEMATPEVAAMPSMPELAGETPRTDSPLPLPPADAPATGRSVAATGFGFCAGREGDNCVIDGDSFVFRGEPVRLAGIDTPEIGGARCADERARGEAAERRLHALLNAGEVRLVRVGGRDRDRFGRLLRDAEVDGESVSERLVAEGHARRWTGERQPWC
jgi:endonuclease YncB( thermonuclease family)